MSIEHVVQVRTPTGDTFSRWKSYECNTDYRRLPSSDWRATFGPATADEVKHARDVFRTNPVVEVAVDGTPFCTGKVVAIESGQRRDAEGSYVNVSGADIVAEASKSKLPLGFAMQGDLSYEECINLALSRWGIAVVGDNGLNRQALTYRRVVQRGLTRTTTQEERAQGAAESVTTGGGVRSVEDRESRAIHGRPGEGVVEWLGRFVKHAGFLCWVTYDGSLYVGLPNYSQRPIASLKRAELGSAPDELTIISGALTEKPGDQVTRVTVAGRLGRRGEAATSATVEDADMIALGWDVVHVEVDDSLRDWEKADQKARELLRGSQCDCWEYTCSLAGHAVGQYTPAPDTIVTVTDEVCGLADEPLYCVARSFKYDKRNGATVELTLIKPDLWSA